MKLKGWKKILAFTYMQTVKSKSFKIGTVVVCVLVMLMFAAINVIPALIAGGGFGGIGEGSEGGDGSPAGVNTLYAYTEHELLFDLPEYEDVSCEWVEYKDIESKILEVTAGEKPDLFLLISGQEDFAISFFRPENEAALSKDVAQEFADKFTDDFTKALYLSIGVDEADLPLAQAKVNTYVQIYDEKSEIQQVLVVLLPMMLALIFYMFIVMYAQQIATSMANEKSSRVIELLITSARPLAIITGKIAGTLLVCLTQVAIIGAAGGIAFAATIPFGIATAVNNAPAIGEAMAAAAEFAGNVNISAEIASALPGAFNAGSIIAVIITLILGFLFFALLAGLVGASVSRMEDLAGAMQPLMLIAVLGFMLAYMPSAMNFEGDMDSVITFSHFFPISSPFALPSAILMGEMGTIETVIAVLMLAVMTCLAALLTAKVYESMILYSGSRLKIGQILKMVKKS